jgi:kynurenine formamidase
VVVGVKRARVYDLAHELHDGIPVFPGRFFKQTLAPNAGTPLGDNEVDWTIELVTSTMQVGTHLDALCHLRRGDRGFDGWSLHGDTTPEGATRLGIEQAPQFVTKGWLVDASDAGHVIGPPEHLEPEPGDAVFFYTGHGRHWDDPEAYLEHEPGPGMQTARWLADKQVALTGADTWSYGPVPPEDPNRPFEVPQFLNVDHGIYVVENLKLDELARDGITEFALILTFPKLRGATGAWCTPIALVDTA